MRKISTTLFCASFFLLLVAGCRTACIVNIQSAPSGATVYVNGEKRGVTPAKVRLAFESGEERRWQRGGEDLGLR